MLKITVTKSGSSKTVLKLEGQITHQWVDLLDAECRRHLDLQRSLDLDFSAVNAVDFHGTRMINRFDREQVRIVNCPALLRDQLTENP